MPFGYGDALYPNSLGSGGAPRITKDARIPCVPGGAGGGVVRITACDFTNYGTISALGQSSMTISAGNVLAVPGGASGSVSLILNIIIFKNNFL
jgi:hypothetical protein